MGRLRRKKCLLACLVLAVVCFIVLSAMQLDSDSVDVADDEERVLPDIAALALSGRFHEFISHQAVWGEGNRDFYFFEKVASDEIGAFRELPDPRDEVCRERMGRYRVPRKSKVSVIVVYRNEARSTLLRTIVSVLKRTPAKFLKEIVVIDDFSDDDAPTFNEIDTLSDYIQRITSLYPRTEIIVAGDFNNHNSEWRRHSGQTTPEESTWAELDVMPLGAFINVHRNHQHHGLIESRNLGAKIATGDYIVFLDSHCEVNVDWIEPLLDRLAAYEQIAVSPVLDSIDARTFQYRASSKNLKGGFDWNLHFRWIAMDKEQRDAKTDPSDPFTSPAFAAGVFMISRNWFFKLNGFNPLLKVWGGESIELSIKLWLCGGSGGQIEIVPCSRVGHVFRKTKHSLDLPNGQYLRNRKIIADSWLDEYKYFFYSSTPRAVNARDEHRGPAPGMVNSSGYPVERMKKDLRCRPFAWYLRTVFRELKLPNEDYIAFGKLSSGEKCLKIVPAASSGSVRDVLLKNCYHGDVTHWFLDAKDGRLRSDAGACLNAVTVATDTVDGKDRSDGYGDAEMTMWTVVLEYCKSRWTKSQSWTRMGGKLIHKNARLCLDNPLGEVVTMSKCRHGAPSQLFSFSVELQQQQ